MQPQQQPGQQPQSPGPGQQQQGQPQQEKSGPYPSTPEEAVRFANNIMEEIYRGGAEGPNIEAIMNLPEDMPPEKGIGMIAGKIVGDMIGQLRATNKRPAMKIALGAIRKTVDELIEIAQAAGKEGITPEMAEPAIAVATQLIDEMSGGAPQQGQQPGQQQPAGPSPQQPPQDAAIAMPAMPQQQGGM